MSILFPSITEDVRHAHPITINSLRITLHHIPLILMTRPIESHLNTLPVGVTINGLTLFFRPVANKLMPRIDSLDRLCSNLLHDVINFSRDVGNLDQSLPLVGRVCWDQLFEIQSRHHLLSLFDGAREEAD